MTSTTPLMSPRLGGFKFPQWSFQKTMLDNQNRMAGENHNQSEPSSPDMFNNTSTAEDQIRIQTPDLKNIKAPRLRSGTAERKERRSRLVDRYMSSEEQLSPMESVHSTSSYGDLEDYVADDEDDMLDDEEDQLGWFEEIFGEFTCKMATAVCFIQAGKPKVVDVPVPSLTNSPSLSSESDKMESSSPLTSSTEDELHTYVSPRPKTPVRKRPVGEAFGITVSPDLSTAQTRIPSKIPASSPIPNFSLIQTYQPSSPERKPIQKSAPRQIIDKPKSPETYLPTAPTFLTIDPFAKTAVPKPPTPLTASHQSRINVSVPVPSTPTPSQGHSRIRNLSQKLHLFGKNSSKTDLLDERPKTRDSIDFFGSHKPQLSMSDTFTKARSMSISVGSATTLAPAAGLPKPKMIPRGAAERAPAIEIPPCPENLDLTFDGPVSAAATQGFPKVLRRRKSSSLKN